LVGRPCAACLPAEDRGPTRPVAACTVLGALAAAEALRLLLAPPAHDRRTTVALDGDRCEAAEIAPSAGCPRCGTTS
ncbi:MAG TPA: hypothetical protein VKA21_14945, partial [Candidatus Binatia bacterium]|nr:hypothetical protein [Candidatus Binatia bacterium]